MKIENGSELGRATPACPLVASCEGGTCPPVVSGGGGCEPSPSPDFVSGCEPAEPKNSNAQTLHAPTPPKSPSPRHADTPVLLTIPADQTALAPLLHKLTAEFRRLVILPKYAAETLALFTVHTYAFQLRDVSVYLGIESPEKGCGKTTLLTVLDLLVHNPVVASNISPSAFFRVIEEMQPTLLIDEADTFLHGNDDLRGILNAGYRKKTAFVIRVSNLPRPKPSRDEQSESSALDASTLNAPRSPTPKSPAPRHSYTVPIPNRDPAPHGPNLSGSPTPLHPVSDDSRSDARTLQRSSVPPPPTSLTRFSCWCPKAIATIGYLPETLADRCIVIRMQKKTAGEHCDRIKTLEPTELIAACQDFVETCAQKIADAKPVMPDALSDRASDIWEPLIVLADIAGGAWPAIAREAALGLSAKPQETSPVASLLATILAIFDIKKTDRLFSRELVLILNQFLKSPWAELTKGKPATELWLARVLRPYGIRPCNMLVDGVQLKGYHKNEFIDLNARYVAPKALPPHSSETTKTALPEPGVQASFAPPRPPECFDAGGGERDQG